MQSRGGYTKRESAAIDIDMNSDQNNRNITQERVRQLLWDYGACTPERITAILTRSSDAPSNLQDLFPTRECMNITLPEVRAQLQVMQRQGQVLDAGNGTWDLVNTSARLPRLVRRRLKQALPTEDEDLQELRARVTAELVLDALQMHLTVWKEKPTVRQVAQTADLDLTTTTAALQLLINTEKITGQELSYPTYTPRDRAAEEQAQREEIAALGLVQTTCA